MCGFIGFITDINNKQIDSISNKFNIYFDKLKERGPDYSEVKKITYKSKIIQVGFVRLAIQDLKNNSNKIFYNNGGIILFNGEIYNFKEFKKKYLSDLDLTTNTDTEVLFNLYQKKGCSILSELRGIFSIAYIDLKNEKIDLIRDFTGTKPLYYSYNSRDLFFSSEAWFLYSLSNKEIDENSLNYFLNFGFTQEDKTLIKNVNKVKPRSIYEFNLNDNNLSIKKFFSLSKIKNADLPKKNSSKKLLFDTIKKNLITDTKIGTFLSGGVDSTSISLIAKKFNQNIEAFTTFFLPDKKYEKFNVDFKFTKKVAEDYNLKLNVHYVENEDRLYKDFIKIAEYLDEPVSNLNFLNTYWQTKLAKDKNIKVVLTGDGADELFSGYDRYKSIYIASKLKFLNLFSGKIKKINNLQENEIPFYYYSIFKNNEHKKIFNLERFNDNFKSTDLYNKFHSKDKIDYLNYFDARYWLTNESNYKLDKCSMINSVEARVPYQDADLINQFFFISNKTKFSLFNRKYLLKEMNILPEYIIKRPKTGWFSPEKIFLDIHLENIIKDFFSENIIKNQNILNYNEAIKFFEKFPKENYKIKRHTLTIILFQIWYNNILSLK